MQQAVYSLFLLVCILPWLVSIGLLPRSANYLLELTAMLAAVYVLAEGTRGRFELVRTSYLIVFGCMVVVMVGGILLNGVEAGPVVAGIRIYFRYIPFFFLGAVFAFSDTQLRRQLILLAAICVFQVPVAIYQTFVEIRTSAYFGDKGITGDNTMGTLLGSSTLSMFLAGAIAVLVALQRRGFISLKLMLILFVLFVIPTTINETKATFVILPVALLVTGFVLAKPGQRLRNILVSLFAIVMFAAIFIPIYDHLISQRTYGATITEFFWTQEGRAEGYFDRSTGIGAIEGPEAGRKEMITVPVEYLARDPLKLLFGLGLGNATESSLGPQFTGPYFALFQKFLPMTFSRVVLELGVLGVALMLVLVWMVFNDSRAVAAREPGLLGALAAGWAGVAAVIVFGFFYKDLTIIEQLAVPFWFYSGIIMAHRVRLERRQQQERAAIRRSAQGARRARA